MTLLRSDDAEAHVDDRSVERGLLAQQIGRQHVVSARAQILGTTVADERQGAALGDEHGLAQGDGLEEGRPVPAGSSPIASNWAAT